MRISCKRAFVDSSFRKAEAKAVPPRGGWAALCMAAIATVLAAGHVRAECPQGDPMKMLIGLDRDAIDQQVLWDMGADPFGVDGGRLRLRVCPHMAEQLDRAGVAYEVLFGDMYEAYAQVRPEPPTQRGDGPIRLNESFVDYHDLDALVEAMQRIATDNPQLAALEVIGQSIEGRDIYALRISNNAAVVDHDRPAMVVVGCHHAREWISVEVPLFFADYLIENYLKDGRVTRLLNYTEFWIIPAINPDGYAYTWTDFPNHRFWRKNRRDNGDGTFGVDMNRNYSVGWGGSGSSGSPSGETYRGTEAFSEPETQALRDLMDESAEGGRKFVSLLSYHNYSQVVLYPNGYTTDEVANVDFYEEVAGEMTRLINESHTDPQFDYVFGQTSHLLYIASGGTTDWVHNEKDGTGIIIELRPKYASFEVPPEQILPTAQENLPAFLHMAETTMVPDLRPLDADLDGFLDADDYCPASPAAVQVDALGCAANEEDLDNDGLLNVEDACGDTPVGQQIGEDGCRIEPLFSIRLTANVEVSEIGVDPPDIDASAAIGTGPTGSTIDYSAETTVVLTAPEIAGANRFYHWTVDGEVQPDSQLSLTITTATDVEVEAIFVVPERVEIAGFTRIPDRQNTGLAFVADYSVQIVYTDGSSLPATAVTNWTLGDESMGTLSAQGRLVVYDVDAADGELKTMLTAEVEFSGSRFLAGPFEITVYDAATIAARCVDITLTGPEQVASSDARGFAASILMDGETQSRIRTDETLWTVSWSDPDHAGKVPAVISADGTLSADWVAEDAELVVRAVSINDDGTVCLDEQKVTIVAGAVADEPVGQAVPSSAMCGAAGLIGFIGALLGLLTLRFARRRGT